MIRSEPDHTVGRHHDCCGFPGLVIGLGLAPAAHIRSRCGIEEVSAAFYRRQPQPSCVVFGYAPDGDRRVIGTGRVVDRFPGEWVEFDKSVLAPQPEISRTISVDREHTVVSLR